MLITQEPKYDAIDGKLVNRATGVAIPDDEPVFILRAKDVHAREALEAYACVLTPGLHRDVICQRIADFARFAAQHSDRMKEPDSDRSTLTPNGEASASTVVLGAVRPRKDGTMGKMHDLFDGSNAELLPSDDAAVLKAWNEIMAIAVEHALVVAAFDGFATLALPSAQIEAGWYERCQYNHNIGKHPKTLERERDMKAPNALAQGPGEEPPGPAGATGCAPAPERSEDD